MTYCIFYPCLCLCLCLCLIWCLFINFCVFKLKCLYKVSLKVSFFVGKLILLFGKLNIDFCLCLCMVCIKISNFVSDKASVSFGKLFALFFNIFVFDFCSCMIWCKISNFLFVINLKRLCKV